MVTLTECLAALTVAGAVQVLAGWIATVRFAGLPDSGPAQSRPMSVLKPLCGEEPLLAEALTTLCEQDYPAAWQIVCGVGGDSDTAIPVVRALQLRYPDRDIVLVVDSTRHGTNPKVSNLINMLPAARHDVLVVADSDVHARSDYLRRLAAALSPRGVGLVTTLYAGLPAFRTLASFLGSAQITHCFLPGALLARALGRRDCLGATMCLRRETLARIGGFEVLKDHLADDNILGERVRAAGLDVALAHTVVATTVPEHALVPLWWHELRWARTIRTLAPVAFAPAVLQFPIFLAILTLIASGGAYWAWVLAAAIWAIRALAVRGIDQALDGMLGGLAIRCPLWLLPLRDTLSAAEWAVSYAGRRVDWRGQPLLVDRPSRTSPNPPGPRAGNVTDQPMGDSTGLSKGSHAR